MSCLVMGVHLDEPTATVTNRWSSQMTSPIQKQWTEEDLDAFVRQLSNPQHHVTRLPPSSTDQTAAGQPSSSPRKSSLDLTDSQKGRRPRRAPLSRSETDTMVHFGHGDTAKPEPTRPSSSSSLISGLSGLRLIKNKKLTRSSHATAKKCIAQKSRDDPISPNFLSVDVLDDSSSSCNDHPAVFSGGPSSPEESEAESNKSRGVSASASSSSFVTKDTVSSSSNNNNNGGGAAAVKEGGKKRRFRKMLSRPLKRSQSAGCAKDVPSHSLFLDQRKSKDSESSASIRKERASEGDIHHLPTSDEESTGTATSPTSPTSPTEADYNSKKHHGVGMHKTKSADSAMMAVEDFGTVSPPPSKSKSRNIAKKISRHMQFLRRRHTDSTLGTMDKDEARRLADLDPKDVQNWSRSFESLLFDKSGLELFRGFLISEHSDENIEFWIACQNYKTVKSHKQLAPLAQKIFNDYVAVQARKEINLDSKTRSLTQDNVASNPNRQSFDEAQKRVQALMEKDSYRRFLESEIYQDLASGAVQHKSS